MRWRAGHRRSWSEVQTMTGPNGHLISSLGPIPTPSAEAQAFGPSIGSQGKRPVSSSPLLYTAGNFQPVPARIFITEQTESPDGTPIVARASLDRVGLLSGRRQLQLLPEWPSRSSVGPSAADAEAGVLTGLRREPHRRSLWLCPDVVLPDVHRAPAGSEPIRAAHRLVHLGHDRIAISSSVQEQPGEAHPQPPPHPCNRHGRKSWTIMCAPTLPQDLVQTGDIANTCAETSPTGFEPDFWLERGVDSCRGWRRL